MLYLYRREVRIMITNIINCLPSDVIGAIPLRVGSGGRVLDRVGLRNPAGDPPSRDTAPLSEL